MRLTCPNCGAQYEVPDEVIPKEGRDVQCSACGDTWFQAHPDHPVEPDDISAAEPEAWPEPEAAGDLSHDIEPEPEPAPGPEPDMEPEPQSAPLQRGVSADVAGILQEEAERENALRAAETGGLESQPELGLDDMQDDADIRAEQSRARMAQLRGGDQDAPEEEHPPARPEPATGTRRDLLPDIDEINSTLRNGGRDDGGAVAPVAEPAKKRGGFSRGFLLAVILGVVLFVIYANAGKLAQSVPAAEPALSAYVGMVDQARLWLDSTLGKFVQP